jgi:predicted translin family RNA/ssDNA-binding protein
MINPKLFKSLKKDFDSYGEERRKLISVSNEALMRSKQAIFAFHRDDLEGGNFLLTEVEKVFQNLEKKFNQEPKLRYEGAYRAALEEYTEAKFFGRFLEDGKIDFIKETEIDADSYLAGICDFTGELVRKAVLAATDKKFKKVEGLVTGIRDVIGELIKMNLTGYLRTKYDQAKNNLRRAEEILYDVKMREK